LLEVLLSFLLPTISVTLMIEPRCSACWSTSSRSWLASSAVHLCTPSDTVTFVREG
jgi:hypothetical protein